MDVLNMRNQDLPWNSVAAARVFPTNVLAVPTILPIFTFSNLSFQVLTVDLNNQRRRFLFPHQQQHTLDSQNLPQANTKTLPDVGAVHKHG